MSVTSTAQIMPGSPRGGGDLNRRRYMIDWRVGTDSIYDGVAVVTNVAAGIPALYSAYVFGNESDQYCLLRDIDAERVQPASLWWKVTGTYETPDAREGASGNASAGTTRDSQQAALENPLLMLPEVETQEVIRQEVVQGIYNVNTGVFGPLRNSAGSLFDPPPMRDVAGMSLTISRNEPLTDNHPSLDLAYYNAVNMDTFWGCPPGSWRCKGITSRRETKQLPNGQQAAYLKCTYKFEGRETHDLQILDAGGFAYVTTLGAGTKLMPIVAFDNTPRVGALDGQGFELSAASTPVYLTVRIYPRKMFAALQLPQSFSQVA